MLDTLPNELIILVGIRLKARDLFSLILVNRHFSALLRSTLRSLALLPKNAFAALYWGVLTKDEALTKYILEKGDNIHVTQYLKTIHKSPAECSATTLSWVMDQGLEICLRNSNAYQEMFGFRPVEWAMANRHYALLRLALNESPIEAPAVKNCVGGWLRDAACKGDERAVKILLERGVTTKRIGHFAPPLVTAARMGNTSIVKLLLEYGADIHEKDERGKTAFFNAEEYNKEELAELLLEKSILTDAFFKDNGRPALYLATIYEKDALVRLLMEKGFEFDLGFIDIRGDTMLHIAVKQGKTAIARLFLENGAEVNSTTPGKTALQVAAQMGNESMVELLLEFGADLHFRNAPTWRSALHLSARSSPGIVRMLLEKGADFSIQDRYGWSPLHIAAKHSQMEAVRLLRESGADVNLVDKKGHTPLYWIDGEGLPCMKVET